MAHHFGPQLTHMPSAWAALLDASTDLLALLDDRGCIVWVNAGFERGSGHAPCEAMGQPMAELLAPGKQRNLFEAALAAEPGGQAAEVPWTHRDGEPRFGRVRCQALSDAERIGAARTLFVLQDCTEAHRLSVEASRQAELLDMAQEFGRLGVWEREIPSGKGRWDRHMFHFFGIDPSDGTPNFSLAEESIHPDDRSAVQYRQSTLAAGWYSSRYRIVLPDGKIRRLHSHWEVKNSPAGVPVRTVGLVVDDTEVYELAEALHETDAQLKIALELGRIGIWRHDLKLNRIFYNDNAFSILGMEPMPEGMTLEFVRSLIHPDDMAQVVATATQALASDAPIDMSARYRHADGSWMDVLTRRVVRRDANGVPIEFIGVGLDVTAQVEKLRRADEQAKWLAIAASSAGVGVWSRNAKTGRADWNEQMFTITGRTPELGSPTREEWISEIVHPADRQAMRAAHARLLTNEVSFENECRIIRPNGEVRWLVNRARREKHDERWTIFGVTIDVTERVRTEAALRSANARVALAARSAGVGTWEWDLDTGKAVWDDAMFRLRGLEPRPEAPDAAERLAMTHPDDTPTLEAILTEAKASPHSTAYEFRVVWPDGKVRWLASRSTVAPDEADQPRRRIGVNWDVTEARNAETSRREREVARRESQAKSEFLSRMSHELRTPLNAVLGFSQLLRLEADLLQPEQLVKIAHIQSAGEHLLSLIDDVLDLSSLESDQFKLDLRPVPLSEVLHEALPLVEGLARAQGIALFVEPLAGVVLGDRIRLRQVTINLLSNAIKYNRPKGRVTVSTHTENGHVTLRVKDTGRGMTEIQQAHLFEPFNRLGIESEGIEGTGIGLAVVKALVERMGGTVRVSSAAGVGSQFEVRLPRSAQVAAPAALTGLTAPATAAPGPAAARAGLLLYIEDNPVNVLLVEELVRTRAGLAIESVNTGRGGIERARSLKPDLILVDIQLPDLDGFEVLRRLRAQPETADTRCVALSANAMPEDITRARAAGFSDYWTKPIDFTIFLGALDQLFPRS